MSKDTATERKIDWQPLRVLALKTPYTMEYLSLMARRKQLKTKKVGRLWYSTLGNIRGFEKEMQARKEEKREKMRAKYFHQGEKKLPAKIRVSQAAIFDQIQSELEEVLKEIREKENRLREEYQEGISRIPLRVAATMPAPGRVAAESAKPRALFQKKKAKEEYLQKEKRETEDLSEKLIMDLGKLLNTANQIQEDVKESQDRPGNRPGDWSEERPVEPDIDNHAPFLSLNYAPEFQETPKRKGSLMKTLILAVIGILAVLLLVFILFLAYET